MADAAAPGPRSAGALALLLAAGAGVLAGFVALGVWQVHRLAWKEALIARVDRRLAAAPVAAPGPTAWPALAAERDEYRRVRVNGRFDCALDTRVRASTELGPGDWLLTPLLRDDHGGWVLVNRGFVPAGWQEPAKCDAAAAGPQAVSGLLRLSEPHGSLLQPNDPAASRWYSRDVPAIAAARGLGSAARPGPVAPYFIDAGEPGVVARGWPRAGLTVVRFRNEHLVYALTWFALAAMTVGALAFLLFDERRLRRAAAGRARALARD